MNEETILDSKQSGVTKNVVNQQQNDLDQFQKDGLSTEQHNTFDKGKNREGVKMAASAVAGAVFGAAAVLTPKLVFPHSFEGHGENPDTPVEEGIEEIEALAVNNHLTGHDMDVATGVDDSMSFNEAFAAARHEVGPGGMFVWHGNTYGTYYANEWNAMSPEEHDQYWADVNHSTSNLNTTAQEEPGSISEEPIPDPNPDDGSIEGSLASHSNNSNEEPGEPQPPTPPESSVPGDEIEPLVLTEEDVLIEIDSDGDGIVDAAIVDVDGNDMLDLIMDTSGDGQFDTLVIDPELDDNGDIVADDDNIVDINGVEILPNSNFGLEDPEQIAIGSGEEGPFSNAFDDGPVIENPDLDILSSIDPDPNITIDNNLDMSEFA